MTKQEFLTWLAAGLGELTESDTQERLNFYSEMIDDRVEEGLSEQEAVSQIGNVELIIASILDEIPQREQKAVITKVENPTHKQEAPKKQEKKRMETWQILLLCLGFPLWLPLLVAGLAVLISLLAVLWSLVISAWAVFVSLAGTGLGGILGGVIYCFRLPVGGIALMGAGLVCAGLAIPAFYGCLAATKGSVWLTKTVCVAIFKFFFERGETA